MKKDESKLISMLFVLVTVGVVGIVGLIVYQGVRANDIKNNQQPYNSQKYLSTVSDNSVINKDQATIVVTKEFGGVVDSVETGQFDGKAVWKVQLKTDDGNWSQVMVEKATGKILQGVTTAK